jgi:hypothetical protein
LIRKNDERSNNKISKIHLPYYTVMYQNFN